MAEPDTRAKLEVNILKAYLVLHLLALYGGAAVQENEVDVLGSLTDLVLRENWGIPEIKCDM